ncbi:hypothetical protein CMV_026802 [Castanea mollissima]|uniref:Uncharacterized protein n=1 Tax=Castanea mollissima TaxID=60419 RepID=A0A8J4QL16_9ROSI|nr:hypothetical protein CMV_026802 [Castanea mollissima]
MNSPDFTSKQLKLNLLPSKHQGRCHAFHTFGEPIKEGDKLTETSDCIPIISEARKDPLSTLYSERLLFLVAAFTVLVSYPSMLAG